MHKIAFFVPKNEKECVKEALFSIGVGRYKKYDKCSWEVLGEGQFRPLEGSKPFIGNQGVVETVEEFKIEMICPDELIKDAVRVLIEAHPYEEPAYEVWRLETIETL